MSQTATSPRYSQHSSVPADAPPLRHQNQAPGSSSAMPPLFSPRLNTPQQPHQQAHTPKTPSPNYFGFQATGEGNGYMSDAPHAKQNWSPPSSTVRSTAAASPSVIPHDQNPEFDAFRKQSEGKTFNLGNLGEFNMTAPPARSSHHKSQSRSSVSKDDSKPVSGSKSLGPPASRIAKDNLDPSTAETSQSPKRMLSPGSLTYPELTRRASPATMSHSESAFKDDQDASSDRAPRVKLPLDKSMSGNFSVPKNRSETLPASNDTDGQILVTPQHVVNLIESGRDQILILDLRVSTLYAQSHIQDSLNLCIPTTLLKRPSFNPQKLAETFKDEEQRARFEDWQNVKYIVVYDSSSPTLKDATTCINTIKKFKAEGYAGTPYIIKGGFNEFSKRFPSYVESGARSNAGSPANSPGCQDGPEVAPVIGGCPMPSTDKPANPFFGNIRQNMDLIGGVGQMALKHPSRATKKTADVAFPDWLKQISEENDQGKRASKRFEQIERREKKRMEDALSGKVTFNDNPDSSKSKKGIQIAGIEKGTKNRYNNIWPYEHSRVKIKDVPNHDCDYFNASYIQASLSHKRYISTQAPIPATFNDFWNIVWQQDVRVMVMLTAEKEGAQVKAHNYWDQKQYGPMNLEFLSEQRASIEPAKIHRSKKRPSTGRRSSTNPANVPLATHTAKDDKSGSEQPYVIVRRFTLRHNGFPFERMREITQLQYSHWPDFGAPAHPAHLLGLVEQCEAVVRTVNKTHSADPEPPKSRPILVHCSAGCGRTGTFCTVDTVIDMLKRQRLAQSSSRQGTPMDIDSNSPAPPRHKSMGDNDFFQNGPSAPPQPETNDGPEGPWVQKNDVDLVERVVEDFRHQRLSMVQSLRQYVLCYESVMEWLVEQEQGPSSPVHE